LSQDLNTLSSNNEFIKFADDSTLFVTENSDISVAVEFTNVQDWAKHTRLDDITTKTFLNIAKQKIIIFHNPRLPRAIPIPIPHIKQVTSVKLLGVYVSCGII